RRRRHRCAGRRCGRTKAPRRLSACIPRHYRSRGRSPSGFRFVAPSARTILARSPQAADQMSVRQRAETARFPRLAVLFALMTAQAHALDLETDLSTHYIEIRTTFRGAALTVFGSLSGQTEDDERPDAPKLDVIVVVKGPMETLAV